MKHISTFAASFVLATALSLSGCAAADGTQAAQGTPIGLDAAAPTEQAIEEDGSAPEADAAAGAVEETTPAVEAPAAANDLAEDADALVATYAGAFQQAEYYDEQSGLSITYNLYLPAGYDESKTYPAVVFIADSSCAGGDPARSLTQGRGALVWASDAWQAAHECIVVVPTYPETILDDRDGYTTTEYVELTGRLVRGLPETYAVDPARIYGTGQSMGCMTTLILASEYPDLYAACMFVDGQWDVSTLQGLEGVPFVYFAAEDDQKAFEGIQQVMAMFDADGVPYSRTQWFGWATPDDITQASAALFSEGNDANFITWGSGSIEASGGMGGSVAYHMASFGYAYRCIAVMDWVFAH